MRKIFLFSLIVFILFQYCGKPTIKKNQQYVIVKFFIGTVMKCREGENRWQKLKIGERLTINNFIKTSENSQCDLQIAKTGIFRLKQNSEIFLKNLFYDEKTGQEKRELTLNTGKVFVKVKKLLKTRSSFIVETPTAVVGVRGTEFVVQTTKKQDTKIIVRKGIVKCKPKLKIKPEEMKSLSDDLKNVVEKEVVLKASETTSIKKEIVTKIEEIVKENITKGTIEKEKADALTKIVDKEIVTHKIKKELEKSLDEFETLKIDKRIEKKQGKLTIETEPTGAVVNINNNPVGETPLSTLVNIGEELNIIIDKQGFKTIEKKIKIEKERMVIKDILEQSIQKGSILWKFKSNSGIKSDIIGEANRVYFASIDGTVYSIDNQAKQIWKYKIPSGVSSSPVIYGNLLFIGGNDGTLYALSKLNGRLSWKKRIGTIAYSKPLIVSGRIYVGTSQGQFLALSAADGTTLWKYKAESGIYSTPAAKGKLIFFGCEDRNIYALDMQGNLKWKYKTGGRIIKSSPVLHKDSLFIGSNDGILYCLNIRNGTVKWKFQTGKKILSTPTIAGNKIFVGSTDGKLYALNNTTGQLVWKKRIGRKIEATPVIRRGVVYIGSDNGNVYAVSAKNGMLLWKSMIKGKIGGKLMITAKNVYAGSTKGEISAIAR